MSLSDLHTCNNRMVQDGKYGSLPLRNQNFLEIAHGTATLSILGY